MVFVRTAVTVLQHSFECIIQCVHKGDILARQLKTALVTEFHRDLNVLIFRKRSLAAGFLRFFHRHTGNIGASDKRSVREQIRVGDRLRIGRSGAFLFSAEQRLDLRTAGKAHRQDQREKHHQKHTQQVLFHYFPLPFFRLFQYFLTIGILSLSCSFLHGKTAWQSTYS